MASSKMLYAVQRLQDGGIVPEGCMIKGWTADFLETQLGLQDPPVADVPKPDEPIGEDADAPVIEESPEPEPKSVPQKIDMDISDYERLHMEHSRCVWALERILRPITWTTMDSEGLVCTIAREALNHPEPKPEPTQDEDDNNEVEPDDRS